MNTEDILNNFGKNLKHCRIEKGLSQEKLALDNNFDRTYVSMLERGKRNPSLVTIYKLASSLDIDIIKLLEKIE